MKKENKKMESTGLGVVYLKEVKRLRKQLTAVIDMLLGGVTPRCEECGSGSIKRTEYLGEVTCEKCGIGWEIDE